MRKIRILIVDDAVVIRKMVSDVLASDPEIEIAGTAANGKIALAKIPQVNPDLITLDVEMPEMDGLEALRQIRKIYPRLPVIMFSTLTERGGTATLDALALGATDYVTKPANVGSVTIAMQRVRDELIPKIKSLCKVAVVPDRQPPPSIHRPPQEGGFASRMPSLLPLRTGKGPIDIVAIGVSTGGPNALSDLLPELPKDFPVPIVIVQHMPEIFTKLFADRLDSKCAVGVSEGALHDTLRPGHVFIAPGDYHMTLKRDGLYVKVQTNREPPENSCRPAVDVLFRSVVQVFGPRVLAIILTGMGQDGLRGCQHVRDAGGQIIAQDEASSVVWGMPGFVANAGLADKVLPLNQIAQEIIQRTNPVRPAPQLSYQLG